MKYIYTTLLLISSSVGNAGEIAEFVGAYLANEEGECKRSSVYGEEYPDYNSSGVCIPMSAMLDEKKKELINLAVTELKNPELLEAMTQFEQAKRQPTEAYEVKIDKKSGDLLKLVDGSVLEMVGSGNIGNVGYQEKSILYKDGERWKFCVNSYSLKVDILKYVEYHYSKTRLSGKSVKDIESMDICS